MAETVALLDLTKEELEEFVASLGEPEYRADQIWHWLYEELATDFQRMTTLPAELRDELADMARIGRLNPIREITSTDRWTRKALFDLEDGEMLETVLMEYDERNTVCISSQVGCAMGCTFCATGQMGFNRNLTAGEIVEQVLHFERYLRGMGEHVTNVVFMGMGEPMANWSNMWQAVETLNHPQGFRLGARRMTVSTVGLVPGIRRLSRQDIQIRLAVSLHAPSDELRDELVPVVNPRWPISELMDACRDYIERTNRRITFEYCMIDGINDSLELARAFGTLIEDVLCHVNLIPLNPTPEVSWQPSPRHRIEAFSQELRRRGIPTTVRVRRGIDIEAGCGQLYTDETERRKTALAGARA